MLQIYFSSLFSVVTAAELWVPGEYEYPRVSDVSNWNQGKTEKSSVNQLVPENMAVNYRYPKFDIEESSRLERQPQPEADEWEQTVPDDIWARGLPGDHGYPHSGREHAKSFMNEWTVEIDGSEEVAQLVALELGYVYGGPVKGFPHMYRFLKYEHEKHRRTSSTHTSALIKDRRVRWAEQLFAKYRVKRFPLPDADQELHRVKRLEDNIIYGGRKPLFNDELWVHEWYLQDTRTARSLPRLDLNVLPVYRLGYNGSGVRISVLDDGIEHNHTDLRANYADFENVLEGRSIRSEATWQQPDDRQIDIDKLRFILNTIDLARCTFYIDFEPYICIHKDSQISWDSNDGDSDPSPRYDMGMTNSHGTRCAGEIAMTANNVKCGVGVAWGAKVGGVRMLDGRITDRVEGEAIAYAADKVDIYSASWGPNDDGRTVEGPGRLALEAFKKGVTIGRGGKGAIYVWANGNGGGHEDNCNCDGYSSSIYTVSIGSASQHGEFPWYGEICSSTLAVAYSSGAYKDQKIATTDTGDSCTLKHTGTSAAAPLAAGILALALQASPNLTWRDVQHIIVHTSDYGPLSANPGWQVNGIGKYFDIRFGFGLLNAGKLVSAALNWTTVPPKHICRFESSPVEILLSSQDSVDVEIAVDGCAVNYLEHVEAVVNVRHSRRGALEIYLTSPQGTRVQLLSARPRDTSMAGFMDWPLMSVATWGESPTGIWILTVQDMTDEENTGKVGPIGLIVHGTAEMPGHMRSSTRDTWTSDGEDIEVEPTLISDVENELQRTNHRNNDFAYIGA